MILAARKKRGDGEDERAWFGKPGALILAIASLFAVSCERCQTEPSPVCQPECSRGFVCDEDRNICLAANLTTYEGEPGGRAARVTLVERRPFVALIQPTESLVLIGYADEREPSFEILSQNVRPGTSRVAVAVGGGKLSVAWIGDRGFYRIATRELTGEDAGAWSIELVRAVEGDEMVPTYQSTDDFDLEIDADGRRAIVFRDRSTRALQWLRERADVTNWTLGVIDDGLTAGVDACPESTRQEQRRGLGIEPDLVFAQDTFYVAYHDADCGDLRLARLGPSGRWLISVLDRGSEDATPTTWTTGRFPSLAIDALGRPAVSYQDLSRGRLLFGVLDGEDFASEVVDPGWGVARTTQRPKKIVGAFSTLGYDNDEQPFITYFDAGEANLMRARALVVDGEGDQRVWAREVLESRGLVGFFSHHVFSSTLGLTVVGERLLPGQNGMRSELVIVTEGSR